ncbi:hypothetical protein FRZ44_23650 [Hypericibacter terrae]|uniref:Uncharacterized protein n=1 Tax=Hypericibacter terrae TaxID=2602015 RepID=A0A5J6MHW2_9PROT|nr:hypothetical protein FRZ44_23650 [Hypericibacter terrae]
MFSTPCSFRNQGSARSGILAEETQDAVGAFQKPAGKRGGRCARPGIGPGNSRKSVRSALIPGHPQNLAYIYSRERRRSVRSGQRADRPLSETDGRA